MIPLVVSAVLATLSSWSASRRRQVARSTTLEWGILPASESFDAAFEYLNEDTVMEDFDEDEGDDPWAQWVLSSMTWLGLSPEDPVAYLANIEVPIEARRAGLGREILTQLEADAARRGATGVVLYATDVSDTGDPRGFYLRLGYQEILRAPYGSVMYKALRRQIPTQPGSKRRVAQLGVTEQTLQGLEAHDQEWAQAHGAPSAHAWLSTLDDAAVVEQLGAERARWLLLGPPLQGLDSEVRARVLLDQVYRDLESLGGDADEILERAIEGLMSTRGRIPISALEGRMSTGKALEGAFESLVIMLDNPESEEAKEALPLVRGLQSRPDFPVLRGGLIEISDGRWIFRAWATGADLIDREAYAVGIDGELANIAADLLLAEALLNSLYREAWSEQFAEGMEVFEDLYGRADRST